MTKELDPNAIEAPGTRVDSLPHSASVSDRMALATFLGAELIALITFMTLARNLWFATDEWEFLAARTAFNLGDLFRPHYDHWVTLPILTYRALWWAVGLRSYWPYQLLIVLLHLAAALLVRTIMRRVGVRPWTATAVALILVFFGTDAQNIVTPFQITIVGSLVFGFIQMLLVVRHKPTRRLDVCGLVAGCAALMCSGVGVAMVLGVGVAALLFRGWRAALVQTVPLAVVYLTWYAVIGHQRTPGSAGYEANVGSLVGFVGHLSSWTLNSIGHLFGVGAALAIILVVGLVVAWSPLRGIAFRQQAAMPIGLLAAAVAFMCIAAVGRSEFGAVGGFGSRYLGVVAALVLPAIGVAADAVMRRWRAAIPLVAALLLIGIPGNISAFAKTTSDPADIRYDRQVRDLTLSLPYVPAARRAPRDLVPNPDGFTFLVTIGWLRDGAASGRVPKPAHITPEQQTMDTLRLSFRQSSNGPLRTDVCATLHRPVVINLAKGDHVVVGAEDGGAVFVPIGKLVRGTLPFKAITQFGQTYTATRRVSFRVRSRVSGLRIVCAARSSFQRGTPTFPASG